MGSLIWLFSLINLFSFAQGAEKCRGPIIHETRVSPFILQEFAANLQDRQNFFLVLPSDQCWNLEKIKIFDHDGRTVGELLIDKTWAGSIRSPMLGDSPRGSLPRDWILDLNRRRLEFRSFLIFSLSQFGVSLSKENFGDLLNEFRVVQGKLHVKENYYLSWRGGVPPKESAEDPIISYDQLVSELHKGTIEVFELRVTPPVANQWQLPRAESIIWPSGGTRVKPIVLDEVLSILRREGEHRFQTLKGKDVVIAGDRLSFLALQSYLRPFGVKKISWFKNAPQAWNNRPIENSNPLREEKIADGEEVLRSLRDKKTTLVDLRIITPHTGWKIPKAHVAYKIATTGKEMPSSMGNKKDPTETYYRFMNRLVGLKTEKIIVYTYHQDDWSKTDIKMIHRDLKNTPVKEIKFYREGWVDWIGRTDWLASDGYSIEPIHSPPSKIGQ